jgi:phosphate transport system protein
MVKVIKTPRQVNPQSAKLESRLLELGQLAETSVSRAIMALVHRDELLARAVIQEDADIDRLEVEIEELCLQILEHDRPRGDELRLVVSVLKINNDLERIGDLAENVAEVVIEVGDWDRFRRVAGITEMADLAQRMLEMSVRSLVTRDPFLAREVIQADDRLDALDDRIQERIERELDRIPENANPLLKLDHVARQFERVGDIATNIAEEVIYLVEGHIVRHR